MYSGLTSRCNTLSQAYRIAKDYNDKLVIIWTLEDACNISYYDVFSEKQFDDIDIEIIETIKDSLFKNIPKLIKQFKIKDILNELRFRKYYREITSGTRYVEYNPYPGVGWEGAEFEHHLRACDAKVREILAGKTPDKLFLHAFNGIFYNSIPSHDELAAIKFSDSILKQVDEIVGIREMVGLHIRRTDHIKAIEESPIEGFIKAIEEEVSRDSGTLFFLATDSEEEEETLKVLFGDRIVIQANKHWGRVDKDSMISGVIDLLCLSRCKYIYGSSGSAFSKFASVYANIELRIVRG